MKGYRKPSGVYIEVGDEIPVSGTLTPVAVRPSDQHTWGATWDADPMNASVCWRLKTAAELMAEQDTALQEFLDSPGGKVVKSIVLVGIDKGHWTLAELRTKYRTL
jgi:hypothetical protein